MQDFHTLRVWQKARQLALAVRRLVRGFPKRGFSALSNQMIRSSESIDDNIVEGCGSGSGREFAQSLDHAIRSATELEGQLERARDYGIVSEWTWEKHADEVVAIRKMAYALRRRVLAADDSRAPRGSSGPGGVVRRGDCENLRFSNSPREDSVPKNSSPKDSPPENQSPEDSIPEDSIPEDSIPEDSIPEDSIPEDSTPEDPIPEDPIPETQ